MELIKDLFTGKFGADLVGPHNGISREELEEIYAEGFSRGLFIGIALSSGLFVVLKLLL